MRSRPLVIGYLTLVADNRDVERKLTTTPLTRVVERCSILEAGDLAVEIRRTTIHSSAAAMVYFFEKIYDVNSTCTWVCNKF